VTATQDHPSTDGRTPRPPWLRSAILVGVAFLAAAIVVTVAIAIGPAGSPGGPQVTALDTNPDLDPGTPLSGRAPGFTLTNQFGRPVSLASFRGHVVILAFNDSQCTTVCPLTTSAMVAAKGLLGAAGNDVDLLGIDANPKATAVGWVRAYSQAHGLLHQWQFLTGSLPELRRVWRAYHIYVAITAGQIDHTPAVYVINRQGELAKIYETQMAYASVGQQAQLLAHEAAGLLPGHPRVHSALSYAQIPSVGPATAATLPRAGGGSVAIGPNGAPRLYVFFASWLAETMDVGHQLDVLRTYDATAAARGLPRLTAVDEASVEPSTAALPQFLRTLPAPLSYPVAIDRSGRVADGYLVQDQPWFVLVSRSGSILWFWDASTQGWLSVPQLVEHVGAALTATPRVKPPPLRALPRLLAGSPPPLAALHRQAGRLLGSESALLARVRALRGYPIVVNAWASWCPGCRNEYPLFASASVRYGRQVAFLGVDTLDYGTGYARSYLAGHPLSYPSYQSPDGQLAGIAALYGLPTTIYIDRRGSVVKVIPGQYDSQGDLDGDIQHYLGL
jgi:cytochrome oxidase Cu insertion factor (SCO1/SenC/PrrC family)/thiol-disulfide isomerase/thioredoxin